MQHPGILQPAEFPVDRRSVSRGPREGSSERQQGRLLMIDAGCRTVASRTAHSSRLIPLLPRLTRSALLHRAFALCMALAGTAGRKSNSALGLRCPPQPAALLLPPETPRNMQRRAQPPVSKTKSPHTPAATDQDLDFIVNSPCIASVRADAPGCSCATYLLLCTLALISAMSTC
jgi:hypothetical protein